jgi:hypothetical protein
VFAGILLAGELPSALGVVGAVLLDGEGVVLGVEGVVLGV